MKNACYIEDESRFLYTCIHKVLHVALLGLSMVSLRNIFFSSLSLRGGSGKWTRNGRVWKDKDAKEDACINSCPIDKGLQISFGAVSTKYKCQSICM